MMIKRQIPNLFTMANLACGTLAIVAIFLAQNPFWAAMLAVFALVFDFLDGFLARLLGVSGELGKQLDSLADMVTFGLLPGVIVFDLMGASNWYAYIPLIAIPVFSAYRLGKFNIDTRQSENFIGMPTPANAAFWIPLPVIVIDSSFAAEEAFLGWPVQDWDRWSQFAETSALAAIILNPVFIIVMTVLMCFFMVSEIPMFSLKFKNLRWAENKTRFIFIVLAIAAGVAPIFVFENLFLGLPIIILLYLLISIVNSLAHKNEVQS
jgi:CDP-diacylglycerol--serine O-phosphatidyltransferase